MIHWNLNEVLQTQSNLESQNFAYLNSSPPGEAEKFDEHDPAPVPEAGKEKPAKSVVPCSNIEADDEDEMLQVPQPESECSFMVFVGSDTKKPEPPGDFREREAFKKLESKGLTDVPPAPYCGIYFHRVTKQWHTRYGESGEKHSAPTYHEGLRSEGKAILIALLGMWKWFAVHTKNKTDAKYVAILQKELDETPF